MTDNTSYIDVKLVTEYPINTKDGISYLPKFVERGTTKGERTYERRENVTFYPLDLVTSNEEETTTVEETESIIHNNL
jgi:hypothetical protein